MSLSQDPKPSHSSQTSALAGVVVVLCEPQDPINIGNTVRAMKNMGLTRLRLVKPRNRDPRAISISAPRADDIIDHIEVFDSLDEALADTVMTVAMTARARKERWILHRPREIAPLVVARSHEGPVALLFGREDRGLTNTQVERADRIVTIPTRTDYSSLNLGQAVLLMAYEIFLAADNLPELPTAKRPFPRATHAELEGLYTESEHALREIAFFKGSSTGSNVMRTLRSALGRAELDAREVRLFRGIFVEVVAYVDRALGR